MPKSQDNKKIAKIRHSLAHVMATAVQELYPKVKFGIGPAIENGFYYDFALPAEASGEGGTLLEDLPKIEKKMCQLIKQDIKFEKKQVSKDEAKKIFKNQSYKLDLINSLEKSEISVYQSGNFVDLCKGPHIKSTKEIDPKAFKLTKIAGAYWKGDEGNEMLTRIYGVAFKTAKELKKHLKQQKEAKKRDHRKIGKKLNLFSFNEAAPGDIFWHPKGFTIVKQLYKYWRKIHQREGYQEVRTPALLTRKTWDKSGHTDFFLDKMYRALTPQAEEWDMAVKPMNCDGHILIYKTKTRSYRDFPLRLGELGVVHRYESSGEVHGILRPREFTQDDAHIFCTPEQIKDELNKVVELCFEVYKKFGLELDHLELSTRPKDSIGSDEIWQKAEGIMKQVLEESDVDYQINKGDGAFYGPKFDFHLKDALGRTWQCSTIQLDFAQPENFDLEYVTEKGAKEKPVMIHRVLYGSIERFLGILIEHYAGAFPFWLSPEQIWILPIGEDHKVYAQKLSRKMVHYRVRLIGSAQTLSKKIRRAEKQKIPYVLVVGDREMKNKTINVRSRDKGELGEMNLKEFLQNAQT